MGEATAPLPSFLASRSLVLSPKMTAKNMGTKKAGLRGCVGTIIRGARVFADADEIIAFWSVYQRPYVEVLVLVIPSAPQTVTSTFPFESA